MSEFFSGNSTLMRDMNRANILDLIRRQGPISQADTAKKLGLQPSTVLRLVKELEGETLIYQSGIGEASSKGGRKASLWELNPQGAFAVGVDLGADEIIAVLVNLAGEVVSRVVKTSPANESSELIMETVKDAIDQVIADNSPYSHKITGIGIGLPGRVDSTKGISHYALSFPKWHNVPVKQILEDHFGLPVYIQGDMQVMALGEQLYGAGKGAAHLLCIGLRKGIGMGVIINGAIYKGSVQTVGDIGHVVVDPNGILCNCGRRGCLATVASEPAVLKWLKEYVRRSGAASFNGIIDSADDLNRDKMYEALQEGIPIVVNRFRESCRLIGRVCCDMVRIFDPEKIIIEGDIVRAFPEYLDLVRDSYREEQPNFASEYPDILPSMLEENGVALGASVLVLSQIFNAFSSEKGMSADLVE